MLKLKYFKGLLLINLSRFLKYQYLNIVKISGVHTVKGGKFLGLIPLLLEQNKKFNWPK